MKLYDVPNRTMVRLLEDIAGPPETPLLKKGDEVFFDHIDGMYSYCKKDGEIVHLLAWADVEIINQ